MSRADEVFENIGRDTPAPQERVLKLEASALIKALERLGPTAILYSKTGTAAMKEALWTVAEPLVKTMALAPDGKTLLEVHE